MKKYLLVAVNAKYIHSNPAVYSLRSFAENKEEASFHIEIAEYTINRPVQELLADIYKRKPDMIAFSCYIWNWEIIQRILPQLAKILPGIPVWLGGPQVSHDGEDILRRFPSVTGMMQGEGEETYQELVSYYLDHWNRANAPSGKVCPQTWKGQEAFEEPDKKGNQVSICDSAPFGSPDKIRKLSQIKGILYREANGERKMTQGRELIDLDRLPFPYAELSHFHNRIIYYESSRGCPFRCSYCLSAIDKSVRFKSLPKVTEELAFFMKHKVPQVKFVDRTFNCHHGHAMAIWQFIKEQDNGITNFHFEVAADILTKEEIELLRSMRPGLIQLEIGVQSTHERTLYSICRKMDFRQVQRNVAALRESRNIHIHLDLIAGLPYEDYDRLACSFNEVYSCRPEQLQLGFLKVLPGTPIRQQAEEYGIAYEEAPPYQVLFTQWISYPQMERLRGVEEMVEIYYNSGQFTNTLQVLVMAFAGPFQMAEQLAAFYEEKGYFLNSPSRTYRYQVLLDFACTYDREKEACYKELLTFDLYLRENAKSRPEYGRDLSPYREKIGEFYQKEEGTGTYLPGYTIYQAKQLARMTHMDVFFYPVYEEEGKDKIIRKKEPEYILFDYQNRNALTKDAAISKVKLPKKE